MSIDLIGLEIWFATGSQHLYGEQTLREVEQHSLHIAQAVGSELKIPVKVSFKPVLTSAQSVLALCREANNAENCVGVIAWMHTFSPAKMWLSGLQALEKPLLHLHTQFNRELPWATIDMDFMNLNQSAHGDREFGFGLSRMRAARKTVVGHWAAADVIDQIDTWARAACAWHDAQHLKIARFGDNMREVAVTEGDKVEAQLRFGYSVNGFGVGHLVQSIADVSEQQVEQTLAEYESEYVVAADLRSGGRLRDGVRQAARIEIGLEQFLEAGGFKAFTDTFEDLFGLDQLPGVAVQRLMKKGYGFGAEGDWKTAALVRAMKVMAHGLPGGTSFMEDYTYNFEGGQVLGAHMLEICPSIADSKPSLQVHPLSIGGKADPARLVFTALSGPAINASIVDVGSRFRLIVNTVDVVPPTKRLERLPVAHAMWIPQPDLATAAKAWITAGGAHHTGFSQAITPEHMEDFAEIAQLEFLLIDSTTDFRQFQKELRWNDIYFHLGKGN